MKTCPDCGPFPGLGICPECGKDVRVSEKKQTATVPDTRSEKEVQADIRDYLDVEGLHYVDTSQALHPQITPGLSDLIVFGGGRMVFAEVKAPGGEPTAHQKRFARWCRRAGAVYVVWRSVEDARQWVEGEEAT